mgnify:CR=1 FL=1
MLPWCANARVSVAPAVGPAWSTLNKQLPNGSAGVSTWRAGVRFEKRFTPNIYLQGAAFYTRYGYSTLNSGVTVDYFTRSVDFPIMLMYKTGKACQPRFVFGGGLLLVQQLGSFAKTEGKPPVDVFSPSRSGMGRGYALTAGFELPAGFTINTSYHTTRLGYIMAPGVYNYRQISITLGYILNKVSRK